MLYKGFEHLWILVSKGVLEPVSIQILRDNSIHEDGWFSKSERI
jgi:hypothetical protein